MWDGGEGGEVESGTIGVRGEEKSGTGGGGMGEAERRGGEGRV